MEREKQGDSLNGGREVVPRFHQESSMKRERTKWTFLTFAPHNRNRGTDGTMKWPNLGCAAPVHVLGYAHENTSTQGGDAGR